MTNAKVALLFCSAGWCALAFAAAEQSTMQAAGSAAIKHYAVSFAFLGAATSLSFDESPTVKKAWSAFLSGVGLSIVATPLIMRWLLASEYGKFVAPLHFEFEVAIAYVLGAGGFYIFPWAISVLRNPLSLVDWWRGKGAPPGGKP